MIPVRDTHVLNPDEIARLSAQNQRLYARLQQGPVPASELLDGWRVYGANHTGRISDVRAAVRQKGGDVVCQEAADGTSLYVLIPPQPTDMYDANAAWGLSAPEGR